MDPSDTSRSYFTKHLFRAGLGCPTKLYYKARSYPENRRALPFIAHNSHNKSQFKALVRSMHPQGIHVSEPSRSDASQKTLEYLTEENITVFDAVFIWNDILARVPVIQKTGNTMNAFYIQTKAFNPDKHRLTDSRGHVYPKWADYLTDFAFQLFIIRKLYPQWEINPFLVLPNKIETAGLNHVYKEVEKLESGDAAYDTRKTGWEKLMVQINVEDEVKAVWRGELFDKGPFEGQTFEEVLEQLKNLYYSDEKYPVTLGLKCRDCEFRLEEDRVDTVKQDGFRECWQTEFDQNTESSNELVFDLIGPDTNIWVKQGLYFQHQVPVERNEAVKKAERSRGRVTARQRQELQVLKAKDTYVPEEIIKSQLFEELREWEYPIHFLDFEAGNYVVPIKSDRKPYHLVVFQYSCHTLNQDGSWQHFEWIDDIGNEYPNYEFIRQLRKIPRLEEGTIVQYSGFERNALKTIRRELKQETENLEDARELIDWIEPIIDRHDSNGGRKPFLADLSRMVRNFYYNNQMGNSLSIKDVVQSIMTRSPYLKQIYQKPYSSSNFDSVIWWQPVEGEELVRNPYSILLDEQSGAGIRRGTQAMVVYGKLLSDKMREEEKKKQIQALLKYCELDTLAMLMIYQHWQALLKENW